MSSITEQVRDSLRALGGSASVADIAEHAGLEKTQVAPAIKTLETAGDVTVNREERPFTATLTDGANAAGEATREKPVRKKRSTQTRAKGARTARQAKATRKRRATAPKPRRTRKTVPQLATMASENLVAIDRAMAMRVAVLALNPAEPVTDEDRIAIAAVIKAAAA